MCESILSQHPSDVETKGLILRSSAAESCEQSKLAKGPGLALAFNTFYYNLMYNFKNEAVLCFEK